MEGGRFDFDDGGSYVGEWREGRAHGLGIATGPENQGEYSGEWQMGFESRGVYIWPSGNVYCGGWMKGKRHGEGVQVKGRWIYRGSFTTGFCGRYGIKESLTSSAKYEGSWHLNQFDGFGVETNSDGSIYAGAWSKGMRQGHGVRRSAPYNMASEFNRTVRAAQSQNSIPSGAESERGWRGGTGSSGGGSGGDVRSTGRSVDERRSGFVLRAFSSSSTGSSNQQAGSRSSSLGHSRSQTPSGEKKSFFKRGIFQKLRRQKSTGDLSLVGGRSMGSFSTQSGCGGGSFFHGRNHRFGSSLRSTLSGSSQLTTKSLARGELRGNLANGLHADVPCDELIGPDVTETYSGQWNEDRRCGYGVAERSDGLRYVGEWFNNKKDGYGVTYHMDGTKEEGRYKENIIVQVLNRRSKLFLLRHSKLRDSVDDAVKKSEEASKKAYESSESAQQRAQTANVYSQTAYKTAQEARRLSNRAREITKEFSPDFVQLGLIWEKQNPLLKPELFGWPADAEAYHHNNSQHSPTGGQPDVNNNSSRLYAASNQANASSGNHLEIGGGSRQGSFRSSFRKQGHQQRQDGRIDTPDGERYAGGYDRQTVDNGLVKNQESFPTRSAPGRPMARAATTGITGAMYAHADQRQMVQHMAQHPHSPYLMTSTSQDLNDLIVDQPTSQRSNRFGQSPPAQRHQPPQHQPDLMHQQAIVNQARVAPKATPMRANEIRLAQAQLIQPPATQFAALAQSTTHKPSSLTQPPISDLTLPPQQRKQKSHGSHHHHSRQGKHRSRTGDHHHRHRSPSPQPIEINHQGQTASTLTPTVDKNHLLVAPAARSPQQQTASLDRQPFTIGTAKRADFSAYDAKMRREREEEAKLLASPYRLRGGRSRTLPSIMTPPAIGDGKRGIQLSHDHGRRFRRTSLDEETAVHSVEHLSAYNDSTMFIIENGIRKRVEACRNRPSRIGQTGLIIDGDKVIETDRPKWTTAYDPYRPGMESTGVVNRFDPTSSRSRRLADLGSLTERRQSRAPLKPQPLFEANQAVLSKLPRSYRIESQVSLRIKSSMPDLPSVVDEYTNPITLARRNLAYGGLTWEEISRLSTDRRSELDREAERRKRGEIVIRLADIKDWMRNNVIIVFVILINATLAFLFFNLLNNNSSSSGSSQARLAASSSSSVPPPSNRRSNQMDATAEKLGRMAKDTMTGLMQKKKKP